MQKTIVSDSSCIIVLEKIGELEILKKLFGQILITSEVAQEVGLQLPEWIEIRNPSDKNYQRILSASVDIGEASSIALGLELSECLLIMDDLKGRKLARQLGLAVTGTLALLVIAKKNGVVSAVKPVLEKLTRTNFRLSSELERWTLRNAGEE